MLLALPTARQRQGGAEGLPIRVGIFEVSSGEVLGSWRRRSVAERGEIRKLRRARDIIHRNAQTEDAKTQFPRTAANIAGSTYRTPDWFAVIGQYGILWQLICADETENAFGSWKSGNSRRPERGLTETGEGISHFCISHFAFRISQELGAGEPAGDAFLAPPHPT